MLLPFPMSARYGLYTAIVVSGVNEIGNEIGIDCNASLGRVWPNGHLLRNKLGEKLMR
jgi:hypothetical protein